jgi:hypothetical protein
MKYTVHGVLAAAYKGKDIDDRALLTHASLDEGDTTLCKRVKHICDLVETGEPTCVTCQARLAKLLEKELPTMTLEELVEKVTERSPHFFSPSTMKFFGDKMSNYRVGKPETFVASAGDEVTCWPLIRKRAVKNGLNSTTYFDVRDFARRYKPVEKP